MYTKGIDMGKSNAYLQCERCELPSWSLGNNRMLEINSQGTCELCQEYEENDFYYINYEKNLESFKNYISTYKGKYKYDAIVMFTGGKDSSYTLYLLKNVYHLNILAVTWDNGFFSDSHIENITQITKTMGIDHQYIKIDWSILKNIYRNRLNNYGRFCNCIPLALLFMAPLIEENIAPAVFLSISVGQTINAALKSLSEEKKKSKDLFDEKILQRGMSSIKYLAKEMYDILCVDLLVGNYEDYALETLKPYFMSLKNLTNNENIMAITPSCFFEWNEKKILTELKKVNWKVPDKKGDYNHTSCLAEEVKAYISFMQKQINLDVLEYSYLLRTNVLTHQEYEKAIKESGYNDTVPEYLSEFLKKLEMKPSELNLIIENKVATNSEIRPINMKTAKYLEVDEIENIHRKIQTIFNTRILI